MIQLFSSYLHLFFISILGLFMSFSVSAVEEDFRAIASEKAWQENLRSAYFSDKKIVAGEANGVIQVNAPFRAENASTVPISIKAKITQDKKRYIKKITIFVDKNPLPLVGTFEFNPAHGKAELSTRIRVNDFSYVRAIAELNNGELYMDKKFVRALGGCSAPPPNSIDDSIAQIGKMRIRLIGEQKKGSPALLELQIKHPSITGLQPLEIGSRTRPPPYFIKQIQINYEGKPVVVSNNMTFAISQDPSFRFMVLPQNASGSIEILATDTKGEKFSFNKEIDFF